MARTSVKRYVADDLMSHLQRLSVKEVVISANQVCLIVSIECKIFPVKRVKSPFVYTPSKNTLWQRVCACIGGDE